MDKHKGRKIKTFTGRDKYIVALKDTIVVGNPK